jgi:SagB-type dehydrogenase family enzyme
MDWSRQPSVFKRYSDEFPVILLDQLPELKDFFQLSAGLTARKVYPGGEYYLRVNPSAGALYPCELYIQARDVRGLEDGIYHFEPQQFCLRLLYSLAENEGLEACCPDKRRISGIVLLVSAIYYRSSWKYRSRALRYCLLDSGHLLGAVESAAWCTGRPFKVQYQLDRKKVADSFGFKNRELMMAMAVCGQREETVVQKLSMALSSVDGSRHHGTDSLIEKSYADCCNLTGCSAVEEQGAFWSAPTGELTKAIAERRSIREFTGTSMSMDEYVTILHAAQESVISDCDQQIQVWSVVNRVDGLQQGLYNGLTCIRTGDFSSFAGYLCLEQALGSDSGVTFFVSSADDNYLSLMQKAGIIGQRIYLAATMQGLGCSGIGAFYDNEVAEFLQTDEIIVYALAVGY